MNGLAVDREAKAACRAAMEAEWSIVQRRVCERAATEMRTLEASEQAIAYVEAMRLYHRVPFILTLWIGDAKLRAAVAEGLGLHIVAMKLFDDLLDDDGPLGRFDLGCSLQLGHLAFRQLCGLAEAPMRILEALCEEFHVICRGQLLTKRTPAIDLATWRAHAESYGAGFLGAYGRLAALAGGVPQCESAATAFGRAFGMMITIADDLRDYVRCGEREGNIGHLLLEGRVSAAELLSLVESMRVLAHEAAEQHAIAHPLRPVIDEYAEDVRLRGLPALLRTQGQSETAAQRS